MLVIRVLKSNMWTAIKRVTTPKVMQEMHLCVAPAKGQLTDRLGAADKRTDLLTVKRVCGRQGGEGRSVHIKKMQILSVGFRLIWLLSVPLLIEHSIGCYCRCELHIPAQPGTLHAEERVLESHSCSFCRRNVYLAHYLIPVSFPWGYAIMIYQQQLTVPMLIIYTYPHLLVLSDNVLL